LYDPGSGGCRYRGCRGERPRGPAPAAVHGGSRGQKSEKRGARRFPEDLPNLREANGRRPSRVDAQAQHGAEGDAQAQHSAKGDAQARHVTKADPGREAQHGDSPEHSAQSCSEENPGSLLQIARRPEHGEKADPAPDTISRPLRLGGRPLVAWVTLFGCGRRGNFRVLVERRRGRRERRRGRDGNRSRRGARRAGVGAGRDLRRRGCRAPGARRATGGRGRVGVVI
jgi:hypothetical protein